jgi:hypothetical protein
MAAVSRLAPLRLPILFALLVAGSGGWALYHHGTLPVPYVRNPLGEPLPDVAVQRASGGELRLRDRIGRRPALIYVFSATQCAGCSNLGLEFRILKGAYPDLQPVLVGSGAPREAFLDAFKAMEISDPVVDESRALLHGLSLTREPVVLLTDSTGRIVFVDQRSASQAAQYPMGRVLTDLQGALRARRAGAAQ